MRTLLAALLLTTLAAADEQPGSELLVLTRPGALYRVSPDGQNSTWKTEMLQELKGRVRDAVVLPEGIATVARTGRLALSNTTRAGPTWSGRPGVLYTTHDHGRNSTRELISSGYSGRIVLLARPAGYGRPELCGDRSRCRSCATEPPSSSR